jgi:hypothetical protein
MADLIEWEQDEALYLFTSLTAGSSHIVTATSRIETILKAARIPFSYVDTATNEGAKKLFQRRAKGKKLPLLVKEGFVIADLEQVEDWNEFGELKDAIGPVATNATSVTTTPAKAPAKAPAAGLGSSSTEPTTTEDGSSEVAKESSVAASMPAALKQAVFESANAAKDKAAAAKEALASKLSSKDKAAEETRESEGTEKKASEIPPEDAPAASLETPVTTHRGSTVSAASAEEIKEIEKKQAIVEDPEEEAKAEAKEEAKVEETKAEAKEEPEVKEEEAKESSKTTETKKASEELESHPVKAVDPVDKLDEKLAEATLSSGGGKPS